MHEVLSHGIDFAKIVLIDLSLAGDNAIVIGMAAAALRPSYRARAILIGTLCACVIRIILTFTATKILDNSYLMLAGAFSLFYICLKMWGNLREEEPKISIDKKDFSKDFLSAIATIVIADITMSIDNVLAVAGAARENKIMLIFGLIFSIMLMGAASSWLANKLEKHKWIGYAGLLTVFYVACDMFSKGLQNLLLI